MPSRKPFYNDNDVDAIRKIANDEQKITIAEGKVMVVFADGTARVQLAGSSTNVSAETTKNTTVVPGDFVFMLRSMITSRWFILTSATIQNITGVLGGASGGAISGAVDTITAPNSFEVTPGDDSLIVQWTPSGVQSGVVYQLSIADDSSGTGEALVLVPGGSYILSVPAGTTKYFRLRSINEAWNTSGWTLRKSGTSLGFVERDFTFASSSPIAVGTFRLGVTIDAVSVVVDTVFNGTASIEVGKSGTTNLLMATTDSDLYSSFIYQVNLEYKCPVDTNIIITLIHSSSTQGSGRVIIHSRN